LLATASLALIRESSAIRKESRTICDTGQSATVTEFELSDTLAPSQGVNQSKIGPLTIARAAFLLHIPEFWKNGILVGAPTVDSRADLSVVEIDT
jgi:hypothetical protein